MPDRLIAEILHGTLVTHARPASRYALAASMLGIELGPPFHRGKGGPGRVDRPRRAGLELGALSGR